MFYRWLLHIGGLCAPFICLGQVTIYQESMGNSGSNASSIALHESTNRFQETSLTYSGSGDMRNTEVSSGYGAASGDFNVLLNNPGETLVMDGLNLSAHTDIRMSYGIFKGSTAEDGSGLEIAYSTSGLSGPFTNIPSPVFSTGSGTTGWYYSSSIIIPNTATTIRFTSTNGSWRLDDLRLEGALMTSSTVNYANLQFPGSGNTNRCNEFNVFAQIWVDGVTPTPGPSPDVEAWIGYSTSNTDPSTWPSTNWIPANYNTQAGPDNNNDEYQLNLGPYLTEPVTYYYASRFRYDGGPFAYGGFNGGFWDGSTNVNGAVTVSDLTANFANVDFPVSGSIDLCESHTVYAQVYYPGITDNAGQGSNITAWIGYNSISQTYDVTADTGWTWIEATYNSDQGPPWDNDQNDQYEVTFGSDLPPGTYYYASRFQLNCNDYSYGGIVGNNYGNFWGITIPTTSDIPYSGILTVNDPGPANVVITEIMYNSSGTDDEWIEICNVSGSSQDLSFYQIQVDGAAVYTFPCGTQIANNNCITVALGDDGNATFNTDCAFTADFSNGAPSGALNNSGATITLYRADGLTSIDEVTYSSSDGGNGNGSSLHVVAIGTDNSNTATNWQEVDLGGSAGSNSLLPNCLPNEAIILVEGNLGSFPDITNGDNSPSGLDNTLFAAQFVGGTQAKSYRISSLGRVDLSISSISLTGDVADFTISSAAISNVVYGSPEILEITFAPTSAGVKTAWVEIINNVADQTPFTFRIQGEGICVNTGVSIAPNTGPPGTIVSVTGTNLLNATADINGLPITVLSSSSNQMELLIPDSAETGNIFIYDDAGCTSIMPFNVISTFLAGCEGGGTLSEVFISEVTDATYGNLSYVELFNATSSAVDLTNYSLRIYSNGNTTVYSEQALSGHNIAINSAFVIEIGASGVNCPESSGSVDLSSISLSGINSGPGNDDFIGLYKNGVLIDAWGVFNDDSWMTATAITGDRGFNFRRSKFASNLPQASFSLADWQVIDWVGSGLSSCSTNNYADLGNYDFSRGQLPVITAQPNDLNDICAKSMSISVSAVEGAAGGQGLNYRWYYLAPGDSSWALIPDNALFDDVDTAVLEIANTFSLHNYQFYCEVREDDQTCSFASDAVKLSLKRSIWNGSTWSSGAPDINTIAVISGNHTVTSGNSFSACQLFVDNGFELSIANEAYVEVQNDIISEGDITIETAGALVQNAETAEVSGAGTMRVNKLTSILETVYDYTYWSSPVDSPIFQNVLGNTNPGRRFWFNAQNYEDRFFNDDVDDFAPFAWTPVTPADPMVNGLGYATTHSPADYSGVGQYPYSFTGTFNTGPISVAIYRNDGTATDTNWNLVGNPYPSAINIQEFFNENAFALNPTNGTIDGALYIWSQNTLPSASYNGNEQINFSSDDYIMVNASGTVTPNGSGITNNGYIPSGQAFFVSMHNNGMVIEDLNGIIKRSEVRFTNAMRSTSHNNQFFRSTTASNTNKIWLNLTGDPNIFCQTLISYLPGATSANDGALYDAKRNLSSGKPVILYSIIPGESQKFAIQGKAATDLHYEEVIPLGFKSDLEASFLFSISIGNLEGPFMTTEPVYLYDSYESVLHNLKESSYSFFSEPGEFNDRFSIVFSEAVLSQEDLSLSENTLTIRSKDNRISFSIGGNAPITRIELYDLLGRKLGDYLSNDFSVTLEVPQLKNATFIARVTLENGLVLLKKAFKR